MGMKISNIETFQKLTNEVSNMVGELMAKGYTESDIIVALLGCSKSLIVGNTDRISCDMREAAEYMLA